MESLARKEEVLGVPHGLVEGLMNLLPGPARHDSISSLSTAPPVTLHNVT